MQQSFFKYPSHIFYIQLSPSMKKTLIPTTPYGRFQQFALKRDAIFQNQLHEKQEWSVNFGPFLFHRADWKRIDYAPLFFRGGLSLPFNKTSGHISVWQYHTRSDPVIFSVDLFAVGLNPEILT